MTKAKISEYDAVAANNTDVNGVNIAENCPPSGMNNMGREIMAALKRFQVGSDGDGVTVGGNLVVSGSSTLSTTSISSADINAGTIDATAIGGSTAAAGSFTTLNTSGAVVFNDAGADVDFRVEGDADTHVLFVDASQDNVGIGNNGPEQKLGIISAANDKVLISAYHPGAAYTSTIIGAQTATASGSGFNLFAGFTNVSSYRFKVIGNGDVENSNNSYGGISDVRLKQDIVDAGSQWEDIKNLRVRKYRFKDNPDGFLQIGVIAQEVETFSPGLIEETPNQDFVESPVLDNNGNPVLDENGQTQTKLEQKTSSETTKAVKYSVLYMKAIKALQEAIERIETLEAKVAALEAQ